MQQQYCAVVPTHNHYQVLGTIVGELRNHGLPVIIIDDGSGEPAREAVAKLHVPERDVEVIRLDSNLGKGGAVAAGLRRAFERGFSHAVQVDADGQHDMAQLAALLGASRARPEAIVSGRAVYDASVPLARRYGRWVTHLWVWVETLSFRIADSMCGFRVYPLAPTLAVLDSEPVGKGMDFDTGIMVRLFWRGVPVVQIPVGVVYPKGNTSNFHLYHDNWLVTRMHARLVIGMLGRLPTILRNRPLP
jgi:glycosyltransferase involved in cell wall biosynthesis